MYAFREQLLVPVDEISRISRALHVQQKEMKHQLKLLESLDPNLSPLI